MPQVIPRSIAPTETLVRGIVHPYFYSVSKKRLKPQAFLPAPDQRDVSVLRLAYTDARFCKQHCQGLRMGDDGHYVGMAALAADTVAQANTLPDASGAVTVEASPLNEERQPVATAELTTADAGLPMHADILHRVPMVRGVPNPLAQLVARHLLNGTCYYPDPQPTTSGWAGATLQPPPCAAQNTLDEK